MEIVADFISHLQPGENILFDGIPRSLDQEIQLKKIMNHYHRPYKAIIINISKEEAIKRLTTRRVCPKCKENYPVFYEKNTCKKCGQELITRADDNLESIKIRLDTYGQETLPVIQTYQKEEKLININGTQSIEEVTREIFEKLDPLF